jgi:pimeloyl-ACP methyl ester carboxylesterase
MGTAAPARRMEIHTVEGGGLRLHVREWGRPDGPSILFIHGLSQSHLCWAGQYDSELADEFRLVAYDLRGHGMSQAPLEPEHYTNARLWADDVAAIIDQLHLDRPVLVGWSYGGFVICDYVRAHGQDRIAAINLVGGVVTLGPAAFGTMIGPGFLDHFPDATADDLPTSIRGMRGLVKGWPAQPYPPEDIRRCCARPWSCRPASAPTSPPARSTATTCCARSTRHCWSATAGPTRWCYRPWLSTSWSPARPPNPGGTTASATPHTWKSPSASTASWLS